MRSRLMLLALLLVALQPKLALAVVRYVPEAYPTIQGEECLACQGNGYYEY